MGDVRHNRCEGRWFTGRSDSSSITESIIYSISLWLVALWELSYLPGAAPSSGFPQPGESRSHFPHIIYDEIKLLTASSENNGFGDPEDSGFNLADSIYGIL